LILAAIVVGASALSLYWAFLVPIYQAPDEPQHLDYVLSIYGAHGLLNLRERPTEASYFAFASPAADYLVRRTGFLNVIWQSSIGMAPDYGRETYYANLDRNAPGIGLAPKKNPFIVALYPFGYYTLVAGWLAALDPLHLTLVGTVFAARILSVLLLAITLLLTYGVARELKIKPALALTLTAVIGFLPLTSFVSSYVQPDNLSFTLVTLCMYLALRARRAAFSGRWIAALGLALGALLVTKYQFYVCVVIPIIAMLVSERLFAPQRWRGQKFSPASLLWLAAPSVILGAIQGWVLTNQGSSLVGAMSPSGAPFTVSTAVFFKSLASGPGTFLEYLQTSVGDAFYYYYLGPSAHSFWGDFGWLDAPVLIHSAQVSIVVAGVEVAATFLILVLMLIGLVSTSRRLISIARRGRRRWALRIAFGNPFLNSYLIFTVLMFGLWAVTNSTFGPQGRNWLPYLLPAFLVGILYAPKVLRHRPRIRAFSGIVVASLVLYCAVGGYYSIKTIQQRYYGQPLSVSYLDWSGKERLSSPTASGIDKFGVDCSPNGSVATWPNVREGETITVVGWAIDEAHHSVDSAVFASVDDGAAFPGVYGFPRQDIVTMFTQEAYRNSGFSVSLSTNGLAVGPHSLTIGVVSSDGSGYYALPPVDFTVIG
jgi:4-amino-4-deoxy-L-arabinose transferase-like glycosyltransferase